MRFSDIVGQDEVKERLLLTVKENRISHAQLFLGPEGSGSLPLALAYAQYISCVNQSDTDSCGECPSCRKYSKLIHPDLHFSYPFFAKHKEDTAITFLDEWRRAFLANPYLNLDEWRDQLDAENKQANINIAECHQIIQKLSLKPFEGGYKVLIMWLPEYLDKEGNTLLKVIEEPPAQTLFLLVAQSQEQILNTILSRTQLVKINRLAAADIIEHLQTKHNVPRPIAEQAAYLAEGNLQAALGFAQGTENDNFSLFSNWMRLGHAEKVAELADFTEVLAKLGRENQKNLLRYGLNLIRESLLLQANAPELVKLSADEMQFVQKFGSAVGSVKLNAIADALEKACFHVERNANPKILFLDVSLHFVKILRYHTLPQGTQNILL